MNSNTALLLTPQVDLSLNTKAEYDFIHQSWPIANASDITNEMFTKQTLYHVFDDSTTKTPKPYLTTMEFTSSTVILTDADGISAPLNWILSNGTVIIDGPFDGDDWHITPTGISGSPQALLNSNEMMFALSGRNAQGAANELAMFTYNKALAESIYAKWHASSN